VSNAALWESIPDNRENPVSGSSHSSDCLVVPTLKGDRLRSVVASNTIQWF